MVGAAYPVHPTGDLMYQRILLAYDGSQSGQKALLSCRELAEWGDAQLFLIAVMPLPTPYIGVEGGFYDSGRELEEKKKYNEILEDGLRRLAAVGRAAQGEVVVGDSVQEITEYARKINADLIVVGHQHVDGWAARWWRGSTSPSLVEHAPCNVLVVITH
jgi:nucleotide-binding universal stress UspA family protein